MDEVDLLVRTELLIAESNALYAERQRDALEAELEAAKLNNAMMVMRDHLARQEPDMYLVQGIEAGANWLEVAKWEYDAYAAPVHSVRRRAVKVLEERE